MWEGGEAGGMSGKSKWTKGEMSRTIVVYCIKALTLTLIWAATLETIAVLFSLEIDLTAVLTFAAAAFGGELLLLAFKRVFAKKNDPVE